MKSIIVTIILLFSFSTFAQDSLSDLLKQYNKNNIPYITVQELAMPKTQAIILDARELNEYKTSHLKNAIHVGYDNFKTETITSKFLNKDEEIVVYCSLGIRSETVAHQLKTAGYTNVRNLYGGIFEWKNNDFEVYNNQNTKTDSIHTFSKEWSKWLTKGEKVYPINNNKKSSN